VFCPYSYIIPTENGDVQPGKRLINWAWYYVVRHGSLEMSAIFTDIHGRVHSNTVPRGLINRDVWATQVERHQAQMIAPLAEIITKTPKPFVTKINEVQCSTATFYDGRVVLVGDAFTGFRSHLGMGSEQAARHCIQMDRVWKQEITLEERDSEAILYAKKFILLNRCVGFLGLGWIYATLKTGISYIWLMLKAA
jgi:hypothetical protein